MKIQRIALCALINLFVSCHTPVFCQSTYDPNASTASMQESVSIEASPAVIEYARKQADQNTHEIKDELDKLAASQMSVFANALGWRSNEFQSLRIGNHGTFIIALSSNWMYRIDVSGNQVFRPISNLTHVVPSYNNGNVFDSSDDCKQKLVKIATDMAALLGCDKSVSLNIATIKREALMLGKCGISQDRYNGRYLVRLSSLDGNVYFQVICDHVYKPIRIDTNVVTPDSSRMSAMMVKNVSDTLTYPSALRDTTDDMVFGTFFNSNEYRFESNSYSYEGVDFLDIKSASNPFKRDIFDDRYNGLFDVVNFDGLHDSGDFKFWSYVWWEKYGRVGTARGNWDAGNKSWQKPNVKIQHRSLKDYSIVGEAPKEAYPIPLANNTSKIFPKAVSCQLEPKFYEDLEQCSIAVFSTHGGPLQNRFQIRQVLDIWFILGNSGFKFGRGNLRHLFFPGCGAMGCYKQQTDNMADLSLLSEWLPALYIQGLRTSCGLDGESVGLDRHGWRYYGRYNQGDSISDSWAFGMIDECGVNAPATVSYGDTATEAIMTLVDGRFSTEKAKPVWSAASVWKSVP